MNYKFVINILIKDIFEYTDVAQYINYHGRNRDDWGISINRIYDDIGREYARVYLNDEELATMLKLKYRTFEGD